MDERTHSLHVAGAGQNAWNDAGAGSATGDDRARDDIARSDGASEAVAREAAERAHIQAIEAAQAHRVAMLNASESLGRVIGNAIEVSAILTWSPTKFSTMDQLVSAAAHNLASFRSQLVAITADGIVASTERDAVSDPHDAFPDLYGVTLARMREVHRQMGALIALAETDISNTPALIAMTRSIQEAQMLASISNRGLSMVLDELGMVR